MSDIFNEQIKVEFFTPETGFFGYPGDRGPIGNQGQIGNTGSSTPVVNNVAGYGVCETEETDLAKKVTINNYQVAKNAIVSVRFTHSVPIGSTLDINGTGNRYISYRGEYPDDGTESDATVRSILTTMYDDMDNRLLALNPHFYLEDNNAVTVYCTELGISTLNVTAEQLTKVRLKVNNKVLTENVQRKKCVIYAGTTATFILDGYINNSATSGEAYHLISVDYDDYAYIPQRDMWRVINQDDYQKCWTRSWVNLAGSVGASEIAHTMSFPFEFDKIPTVLVSALSPPYNGGTCTARVYSVTKDSVTLILTRTNTTRSFSFAVSAYA